MNKIIYKNCINFDSQDNLFNETIFHNANGYLGVRGSLCEGVPESFDTMRGIYINGFYDIIPMKQAENLCNFINQKDTMLNVADTTGIKLYVDGHQVNCFEGKIIEHSRMLDMSNGITGRRLVWESPDGKQIEILEKRMTSFVLLSLFTIDLEIKAINFDGDIKIVSSHCPVVSNYCNPNDPRLAASCTSSMQLLDFDIENGNSFAITETKASHLKLASLVAHELCGGSHLDESNTVLGKCAEYTALLHVNQQEQIRFTKTSIFADSIRNTDVKKQTITDYKSYKSHGLDYYYQAQTSYLNDFWSKCDMEIGGDEDLSRAVTFNLFELLQSAPKDQYCSISAKGLSGEGYEGHYFWDAECFVLPFFIQTNQCIAKNALSYRYSCLDKARENARRLGHSKGALFPWRTISGLECSGYYVSADAAYHINADIAYAIVNYYFSSNDEKFIEEQGLEILLETARLWLDVGNYNQSGKFVINGVTGPDEYTCMVNNNYYTNCAAKYNLIWAVNLYNEFSTKNKVATLKTKINLTDVELLEMSRAAENMFLAYDEKLGINPQDDSFLSKPIWDIKNTPKNNFPLLLHYHPLQIYRYQVCKQADTVLSYFMFENEQSKDVMERSFKYYEAITTHDSSLSTCIFSIVASRLGLKDRAYSYFGDSAKLDLENTHLNTQHGIHTANMGGCYMAIVYGFAGLRINENGITINPCLPDNWDFLRFNICYQNKLIHFDISKNKIELKLIEGHELTIQVFDKKCLVSKEKSIVIAV